MPAHSFVTLSFLFKTIWVYCCSRSFGKSGMGCAQFPFLLSMQWQLASPLVVMVTSPVCHSCLLCPWVDRAVALRGSVAWLGCPWNFTVPSECVWGSSWQTWSIDNVKLVSRSEKRIKQSWLITFLAFLYIKSIFSSIWLSLVFFFFNEIFSNGWVSTHIYCLWSY